MMKMATPRTISIERRLLRRKTSRMSRISSTVSSFLSGSCRPHKSASCLGEKHGCCLARLVLHQEWQIPHPHIIGTMLREVQWRGPVPKPLPVKKVLSTCMMVSMLFMTPLILVGCSTENVLSYAKHLSLKGPLLRDVKAEEAPHMLLRLQSPERCCEFDHFMHQEGAAHHIGCPSCACEPHL